MNSPCNYGSLSSRQANKEMYGPQLEELAFRTWSERVKSTPRLLTVGVSFKISD